MASVIIIGLLATLGVIIVILLLLAGGYLWWRHKRSQLKFIEPNEDEESTSGSLRLVVLCYSYCVFSCSFLNRLDSICFASVFRESNPPD